MTLKSEVRPVWVCRTPLLKCIIVSTLWIVVALVGILKQKFWVLSYRCNQYQYLVDKQIGWMFHILFVYITSIYIVKPGPQSNYRMSHLVHSVPLNKILPRRDTKWTWQRETTLEKGGWLSLNLRLSNRDFELVFEPSQASVFDDLGMRLNNQLFFPGVAY